MALRDKMRESSAQFLRPDEPIEAVFGAQTASPYLGPLIGWIVLLIINQYRIFAVTPDRIVVLDAGKWNMATAKGVVAELPRSTRLGPATGIWHVIPVGDEKLRVHRRFFKDIEAADAAGGQAAA
jgi:hypothetical protein